MESNDHMDTDAMRTGNHRPKSQLKVGSSSSPDSRVRSYVVLSQAEVVSVRNKLSLY